MKVRLGSKNIVRYAFMPVSEDCSWYNRSGAKVCIWNEMQLLKSELSQLLHC